LDFFGPILSMNSHSCKGPKSDEINVELIEDYIHV